MKKGTKRTVSVLPVSQIVPVDGNIVNILPEPEIFDTVETLNTKNNSKKNFNYKRWNEYS